MEMLKVFIGYDHRQPVSYTALQQSIIDNSKVPVQITPLVLPTLPLKREGLTPFTFSRFLVPYLCDFKGWALFLDIDMLVLGDIGEFKTLQDSNFDILVSKNEKRFEWASVMLFNCEKCTILTPEYIETAHDLHRLAWCPEDKIGALPPEWNHLVGYDEERTDAKLVHYTQGVPAYEETMMSEYSKEWHAMAQKALSTFPWADLMATSVHATHINDKPLPKFLFEKDCFTPKPKYKKIVNDLINKQMAS